MKIHNATVPLSTAIPGRLVPGSKIVIVGWPTEKCKSFNINLKLGPDDEVALTLSVRFKPSVKTPAVVRNSLTSAGWGQEETETPFFPFLTKQAYKIEILCERARFRISVDDRFLAKFTHRLPLAYVNHLEISGDTELTYVDLPSVEFVGGPKGSGEYGGNVQQQQSSAPYLNNLSLKDDDYDN